MEVIFVLVPVSLMIVFGSIFIFLWAVNNYQFDDLEKEAQRILQDDAAAVLPSEMANDQTLTSTDGSQSSQNPS